MSSRSHTEPLVIRADASPRIGTGHVMRCLALAQAWQDEGGQARFVMAGGPGALMRRLESEGASAHRLEAAPGGDEDARRTAALAQEAGAGWVVVDGYHFGAEYQAALKGAGLRLLVIDDGGHAARYHADLVLNQNLYADEALYARRGPQTRLLLGPSYALLRREFVRRRPPREVPEVARKLLVTLGGSDPDGVTLRAVAALRELGREGLEAVVVVGAANPRREEIASAAQGADGVRVLVNPAEMAGLMEWADFALAAAGSTCWELCCLGLPALLLVLAENQAPVAAACESAGAARDLGWHFCHSTGGLADAIRAARADHAFRAFAAKRGPELIDGRGAARVCAALRGDRVRLRAATADDCRAVWEWANDPTVRAASFRPTPIPWEGHRHWFAGKLASPDCLLFVAETADGQPAGTVRCDLGDAQATISVALAAPFRGRGLGQQVIRQACEQALGTGRVASVLALVRVENAPSRTAFLRAGFVEEGETAVAGCRALRLVYRR